MSARNLWNSVSGRAQTRKMSCIHLTRNSGFMALFSRKVYSNCPMYIVASAGARLVPISRSQVCVKRKSSNWNMLFFSI